MSKAGKGDGVDAGAVGSQHPVPENIPHLSSPVNGSGAGSIPKHATHHGPAPGAQAGSPVKESSFLHRESSAEGGPGEPDEPKEGSAAPPQPLAQADDIPIRR